MIESPSKDDKLPSQISQPTNAHIDDEMDLGPRSRDDLERIGLGGR